ncbi:hypothetical protein Q1695_001761 [Nippostrongylus brasiliensis]|nr:hypothetical protein Q1695_001761 [Nippostrongylus brasiliensis]
MALRIENGFASHVHFPMALCEITTTPQLFSVDSAHFRQLFSQIRIEPHELLQKVSDTRDQQLGQLSLSDNDSKKIYMCQRCLNHGTRLPRKNHKCECPYADCKCEFCYLVEKRRQLNSQLHDLECIESESAKRTDDDDQPPTSNGDIDRMIRVKGERVPNCQKCGQHGQKSRLKGHKRVCPFKDCTCAKCQVVSERQKLMADQIKIRRRQRKDSIMSLQRDHLTSTISAAAALSGQMNFGLGGLGLLYNQLKQQVPQSLLTSPTSSDGSSYSPTTLNPFASSPDLLRTPLLFPSQSQATTTATSSPESATYPSAVSLIAAPVPINPVTPSSFPFQLVANESLLQSLLANYKLFEQTADFSATSESMDTHTINNAIIDVCNV